MQTMPKELFNEESEIADLPKDALNSVKWEFVDGRVIKIPSAGKCFPTEDQDIFAETLCWDLNEQVNFGGRWRVVWRNPTKSRWDSITRMFRAYYPTMLEIQWLDADGDIHICSKSEATLDNMLVWGIEAIVEHAAKAHELWEERNKLLEVSSLPQFSWAKGERPTSMAEQFAAD